MGYGRLSVICGSLTLQSLSHTLLFRIVLSRIVHSGLRRLQFLARANRDLPVQGVVPQVAPNFCRYGKPRNTRKDPVNQKQATSYLEVGSFVVASRAISRITLVVTYIRGLITPLTITHEPPSRPETLKCRGRKKWFWTPIYYNYNMESEKYYRLLIRILYYHKP